MIVLKVRKHFRTSICTIDYIISDFSFNRISNKDIYFNYCVNKRIEKLNDKYNTKLDNMLTFIILNCNYDDWEHSCPEWVHAAKNGNTLILTASVNSTSEERSGKLTVTCYDKTAELVIYQKSKFSIKSIFGSKKK